MDPTTIKLVATLLAIGAAVATIWAPLEADAVLLTIAGAIVGSVWVPRPGDTR
jgi:hypothetical protein